MTRRDVAAMTWALCLARRGDYMEAIAVLMRGPRDVADAAYNARHYTYQRELRARLALYLRARLRAEAGDYGKGVSLCLGCRMWLFGGVAYRCSTHRQWDRWTKCDGVVLRRITPLWEQAR